MCPAPWPGSVGPSPTVRACRKFELASASSTPAAHRACVSFAVCGTAATVRGGSAIVMAQMQATQLVTSGLWGLLYYREIRGRAMLVWVAFALWTITAVVLLGMEKGET